MILPLLGDMLAREPSQRPSAADALQHLKTIRQSVSFAERIWRPRKRDEPFVVTALCDAASLVRKFTLRSNYTTKRFPSAPPLMDTSSDPVHVLDVVNYSASLLQASRRSQLRCMLSFVF